jgi:hypothetical protein
VLREALDAPTRDGVAEGRFLSKISRENGCWIWVGTISKEGHPMFWVDKRLRLAARWGYERFIGPIGDGLVMRRDCGDVRCVNPAHLSAVPRDEVRVHATVCIHGHPFDEANTYISPDGTRACRVCKNENTKRSRRNGSGRPGGWAATRRRVLERDGYLCAVGRLFGLEHQCSDVLDVHHRQARRTGGTNDDDNLYVLCRRHHLKIEAMLRRLERGEDIVPWVRCPHKPGVHRYPGAREACERNLNRRASAA